MQERPQEVVQLDQHPPTHAAPHDPPQAEPQPDEHPEQPVQLLPQEALHVP